MSLSTELYSHELFGDGFITEKKVKNVQNLHVEFKKHRFDMQEDDVPEELIQRELSYQLAQEIIKGGYASLYRNFNQETFEDAIIAEINVCPPGIKMQNVEDEFFKVNGELFTEAELIEAVKNTYPERLL